MALKEATVGIHQTSSFETSLAATKLRAVSLVLNHCYDPRNDCFRSLGQLGANVRCVVQETIKGDVDLLLNRGELENR